MIPEPFVEDELAFPSFLHIRRPPGGEQRAATTTEVAAEIKKRITTDLEASLTAAFTDVNRDDASTAAGFQNLEVGLKYQFVADASRETVASLALTWDVAGTGRAAAGAESFDTLHPALLLGKGFGDLPDRLTALKPLAVATRLGAGIPTRASQPDVLEWGMALEFSLPYWNSIATHVALPAVVNRTIPIVEMDLQTGLDGALAGKTTGTANVGAVWVGKGVQVGLEAVIPVNERSGATIGVRGFVRLDLELVLGRWAGQPLFSSAPEAREERVSHDRH